MRQCGRRRDQGRAIGSLIYWSPSHSPIFQWHPRAIWLENGHRPSKWVLGRLWMFLGHKMCPVHPLWLLQTLILVATSPILHHWILRSSYIITLYSQGIKSGHTSRNWLAYSLGDRYVWARVSILRSWWNAQFVGRISFICYDLAQRRTFQGPEHLLPRGAVAVGGGSLAGPTRQRIHCFFGWCWGRNNSQVI